MNISQSTQPVPVSENLVLSWFTQQHPQWRNSWLALCRAVASKAPRFIQALSTWRSWGIFMFVSLLSLVFGLFQLHAEYKIKQSTAIRLQRSSANSPSAPSQRAIASDFTHELPTHSIADFLIRDAFSTASTIGVSVITAQLGETAQVNKTFNRTNLGFKLKGPYPAIKQLIAELLAQHPGVTLQHLSIQRGSSTTLGLPSFGMPGPNSGPLPPLPPTGISQQEAELTLVLWTMATPFDTPSTKN